MIEKINNNIISIKKSDLRQIIFSSLDDASKFYVFEEEAWNFLVEEIFEKIMKVSI